MRNKFLTIALFGSALAFTGCKPEVKGELGEPFNKVKGFTGTWEISQFLQQDVNNPINEERDLSEFYLVENEDVLRLTFNESPRTYSYTAGAGRNYFGNGGTWKFDNDEFPSYLILEDPADTLTLDLGSIVKDTDNRMSLELPRYCIDGTGGSTKTMVYKFFFNRIQ
jgi:hypothetical protein